MANNYSQPFYGFPHGYPPPQMQQPTPSQEPGRPPHMPRAPGSDAFQSIPGLAPPAALPGINLTSYAQNSQQPPFPMPAWPHQLPPDPNFWALLQSGGFPPPHLPPPPFPNAGFPPSSLPHTPHNPALPLHLPPHNPPQLAQPRAAAIRIHEVMDGEREDGELSEGEISAQPPASRANGCVHMEPPRSVPQPSQASSRVEGGYNPHRPASGQAAPLASMREAPQPNPPTLMDQVRKDREAAKQFIKVLHSNNIPYRTLAIEQLDVELLRGLYQSLNLPSEPAPILLPKTNGTASKAPAVQPTPTAKVPQPKPAPTVKTNVDPAPSAKSAASPTTPGDRKDYIARLQAVKAAKVAKQTGAIRPSSPKPATPVKALSPAPAVKTPQPATTPVAKPPVTDEERARTTALIKQRLEAIKAKQKPAFVNSNDTLMSPAASKQTEQSRGPLQQATSPATSGASAPFTPGYMPPFHGIPGLFMNTPQSFGVAAPITSQPSPSVPQKRPAPSDSAEVSTPSGSVPPYTRPLGQSPHADEEDESMIIEVSEDDSNGSDMEIDDDQAAPKPSNLSPKSAKNQVPGNLSSFPSRAGSAMPIASAVGTPGSQTPTTVVREKELVDKEKQLIILRGALKKKLAEKRERDRAAAAAAAEAAASSSDPNKPTTSVLPQQSDTPSKLPTPMLEFATPNQVQTNIAYADVAPVPTPVQPVRDTKRLRRAEIQSKLPTLDAEIASNASRMAQLTKEMEELMAQNERIAKDKEQLTYELESLGVHTEGMSHAELRAKKDEIDREQSLEPDNSSQVAALAPQQSAGDPISAVQSSQEGIASSGVENEKAVFPALLPSSSQVPESYVMLPGLGQGVHQLSQIADAPVLAPTQDSFPSAGASAIPTSDPQLPTQQDTSQSPDPRMRPVVEAPSANPTTASGTHGPATPLNDDEDFYSPPPPAEVDLDIAINAVDSPENPPTTQPATANSPSEEGEVEMSVSEDEEEEYEPEYEPEEPAVVVADAPSEQPQQPELEVSRSVPTSQVSTEDEEAYEPPDVDQEMSDIQIEAATADPSLILPQDDVEEDAMDIASSSEDSSDDSDSDEESTSGPEVGEPISADNLIQGDANIANDLALELQPDPIPAAIAAEPGPISDDADEPARYTPYESPLRMFKSYRYHPSYAKDIPGGFLSLTFSHQIDSEKPFCQYEAAGGACNDPECPDQHFRDIGITGDKLLVQLGTANPGKTSEEKQKWNDGLRGVLKELRQKNIKDPNGIAVEIAKYRRQFLNDDTRVVNL
ncbi:hypothetical protein EJ02DRAFT_421122 [Clathrospora elynae]|uniref:Putative zinc-finger domain-containing protein n=1 Tax=Clathrospora elynae TaxID=706981 RepID=A0A6A5SYS6_9PLEO|nr:hypothetical protein EJ02DRAFT_421122 [Clathrospora elynae]